MKNLKKCICAAVFAVCTVVMFSGCELLELLNFVQAIADYNTFDIVNNTDEAITLDIVQDIAEVAEGSTRVNKTVTIKAGKTLEKVADGNYYKMTIGDKVVLPDSSMGSSYTTVHDEEYYLIYANYIVTISVDGDGNYTYTEAARPSDSE